ncbi:MAG: hypothetical protein HOO96_43890 [Polyangiaceae bacterium]|nr:hypothetical protein [Polyangiaceae bacterium]
MSEQPRIRKMVLFKHGVAYLERSGPADGAFELSFKREEMSDVLKSLAAWVVRGDAQVNWVAFEKPEDPEQVLRDRNLGFAPGDALSGLLGALRGQKITLSAGGTAKSGELLGYQSVPGESGAEERVVVLRTAAGQLELVQLRTITGMELLEERSRSDVAFILDRSRAATSGENRAVRIHVEGRAEELRVSYVIPAPTWRVSYRVALTGDEAAIMGWGIVHNPAAEDIEGVQLTLTTGQPVSFLIDLYNPKTVARTVVEEQSRVASAPKKFEKARRASMGPAAAPAPMMFAMAAAPMAMDSDTPAGGFGASYEASVTPQAEGVDRGELFEYRIAAPVSIGRGGSAMVPLFLAKTPAKKERIWRDGEPPNPDLVLTFDNDTGVVLEEGPAVIYDGDVYAGESMVPYSARKAKVRLGFAKDLSVHCTGRAQSRTVFTSVQIVRGVLVEEFREETDHVFRVESDHQEPVDVVIEMPRDHTRTLNTAFAMPFEETEGFHRFKITAPPGGMGEITVQARWQRQARVQWQQVDQGRLGRWLSERFLDDGTIEKLRAVLALQDQERELERTLQSWRDHQTQVATRIERSRQQLGVLKDTGPEGELRLRYVRDLEAAQNQMAEADAAAETLVRQIAELQVDARAQLAAVLRDGKE